MWWVAPVRWRTVARITTLRRYRVLEYCGYEYRARRDRKRLPPVSMWDTAQTCEGDGVIVSTILYPKGGARSRAFGILDFRTSMLPNLKDMEALSIYATDGLLGKPKDFYFDDEAWVIRHLMVETDLVARRQVLISPISIRKPDWTEKSLSLSLNREWTSQDSVDTSASSSGSFEFLGTYASQMTMAASRIVE